MRMLVRRFVTAEQRKRDDFGITEDDVMEIRQDISTLRYELIDILRSNGMKTPSVEHVDMSCEFQSFCENKKKHNFDRSITDIRSMQSSAPQWPARRAK